VSALLSNWVNESTLFYLHTCFNTYWSR